MSREVVDSFLGIGDTYTYTHQGSNGESYYQGSFETVSKMVYDISRQTANSTEITDPVDRRRQQACQQFKFEN